MESMKGNAALAGLSGNADLYNYLLNTSVYPRELDPLKELRAISSTHPLAVMGTSPDAGQLMALLLKLVNPKKTIEIGVFTGYSLLLTAINTREDAKILAIDPDRSAYEMGLPVIQKSGVEHKINFVESQALPVLDNLLQDPKNHETFEFAYVDADKSNYVNYHEKLLKLLKRGAVVIYDNTLWSGTVAVAEEILPKHALESRRAMVEFNKLLAADSRVQISQVPAGDGVTICCRL